jgi:integrase
MPKILFTDIAVRNLKPQAKQVSYWDASLPNFGCRVNPKGTVTFNVLLGRERRRVKIGNYPAMTIAMARKRAAELLSAPMTTKDTITWPQARQLFYDHHLKTIRARTGTEYTYVLNNLPLTLPLRDITPTHIHTHLKDLHSTTARNRFTIIKVFLKWCVHNGHLDINPLKKSPYRGQPRERLLTDDEIKKIWRASYKLEDFGVICRLLILTGQRKSQIASLQRDWITPDTITFPASIMKSGKAHTIPTTKLIKEHLHKRTPLLFPTHTGTPFNTFARRTNELRQLVDIPPFVLHNFRAYFSSTCARLGIPIDVTEMILDHRTGSRSIIQRTYDLWDRAPAIKAAMDTYNDHIYRLLYQAHSP